MTSLLACKVKGCPAPESEEWHRCWLIGHGECFGGISHQHTKKRSQGGKVIDACLCIGHHDKVDNGLWGNKIVDGTWVAYDEDHNILVRRNLNGSVSEPETLEGAGSAVARSSGSYSAPLKEEQDAEMEVRMARKVSETHAHSPKLHEGALRDWPGYVAARSGASATDVPSLRGSLEPTVPSELTRAECIRLAQQLRDERERNPWMTGDLLNAAHRIDDPDNSWDSNGDSLLDILRLQPETASNYQRVAAAYSTTERVLGLSFGHHQSVYKLPDRDSWLKLAVDEGLSVSELRRRIKPPQAKPKRWTLEQLRTDLDDWCSEYLDEKKLVRCATCSITREWLDWLEGQEATDEHP